MSPSSPDQPNGARFPRTRWSLVLGAKEREGNEAQMALQELCQLYWRPLYSFIRQSGFGKEDAEDYTQEFLAHLIEKRHLDRAEQDRGKLRSFLLAYLKYFLADKRKAAERLKRGGGHTIVSIDAEEADARFSASFADSTTPDRVYERSWALAHLEIVLKQLEELYRRDGKGELFAALKPNLQWGGDDQSLRAIAEKLGMQEGAVKVAAFRLRKRYRQALRQQIMQTLAEDEDVEEEMRYLFRVLSEPV